MDVAKIDKNFAVKQVSDFESDSYDVSKEPFTIYGGFSEPVRKFEKMPFEYAKSISDGIAWGTGCGAGIRITFSTNSSKIKLNAEYRYAAFKPNMAFMGSTFFALTEDRDGKSFFIRNFVDEQTKETNKCIAEIDLQERKMRNLVLHLPLYSGVGSLTLEFEKGSVVKKYEKFINAKHILYYGSSITQGGCASRADNSYQQLVSEWTGYDYTIVAISGGAKAEEKMADYLKTVDCDIFVCDYDHNAPDAEYLLATHEKLYRRFRENPGHKDIPVIFVSASDGRRFFNGEERFKIIKSTYDKAKAEEENVYLVDGRNFYPEDAYEHCSVDGCHPTDLGFYFMAKAIYEVVKSIR